MSPTFFHRILPCESVLPRQARAPVRHAWGTGVSERSSLRSSSRSKSASQVHPVHPEVDVAKPKSSKSSQSSKSSKSSKSSWSRIDDALMTEEWGC